jgi:hypothetical protein
LSLVVVAATSVIFLFDFIQSSFLSPEEEVALQSLFREPRIGSDYLAAMTALGEYELERVLLTCEARGERLLIYEEVPTSFPFSIIFTAHRTIGCTGRCGMRSRAA